MRLVLPVILCALLSATEPGRIPPRISIERLGAPSIDPAAYRGKIVALAFIYTTCSHCQDLTIVLNKLAPEYTPRGVQFLECAFNPEAQLTMKEFLDRFHPPFPVGWANDAAVRGYLRITLLDTRPLYVPHMVFLDRLGAIRGEYRGESEFFTHSEPSIRAELDKLLQAK
jgi:Redoxin